MAVRNSDIARIFYEMADLLEIDGANSFRIRAYRGAAENIERFPHRVENMVKSGEDLTKINGVGTEIASKIKEIVKTGSLEQLHALEMRIPPELTQLLKVSGLGPRRVQALYANLGITSLKDLQKAAENKKIRSVPGFGAKTEQNILKSLEKKGPSAFSGERRYRIDTAEKIAAPLTAYLEKTGKIERIQIAGSYRRRKETVGDLDILVISPNGEKVLQHFVKYEGVDRILSQGETRATVVLASGIQVDVRVVPRESYGAALLYFTGSKPHNLELRNMAIERGLKINEYGVYKDDQVVAGKTEEEIYALFDMAYIVPELREDRGEIEAALKGDLPHLVSLDDIRGDLHAHTKATDGHATLEEMARYARELGYRYLAITDHTQSLRIAHGLDQNQLAEQMAEIDRLNEQFASEADGGNFRLLKSAEIDILEDGRLDLPDDMLAKLDLRLGSIHSHFHLSRKKQTERVLRAMDNPYFNIFAHPTGRLLLQRDPYEIDLESVMQAAREKGCFLEINAHPERLDLDDSDAMMAKEMGVRLAVSTDAHSTNGLDFMRFGVDQARRGWLEAEDVINTRDWPDLEQLLKR